MSLWDRIGYLKVTLGILCSHFAHFGVTLGSFWVHVVYFGFTLGNFYETLIFRIDFNGFSKLTGELWITLGQFWEYFWRMKVALEGLWGHFGVTFGM